jgi:hypothetical protein
MVIRVKNWRRSWADLSAEEKKSIDKGIDALSDYETALEENGKTVLFESEDGWFEEKVVTAIGMNASGSVVVLDEAGCYPLHPLNDEGKNIFADTRKKYSVPYEIGKWTNGSTMEVRSGFIMPPPPSEGDRYFNEEDWCVSADLHNKAVGPERELILIATWW